MANSTIAAGSKKIGFGAKLPAGRVFNSLVDWQDGNVTGAPQPTVIQQRFEIPQYIRCAIGLGDHAVDEIGSRQMERGGGETAAFVVQ